MPVEDVQYLIEHSVKDSSLIFVDSTQRDRRYHESPAEYVVSFQEPIRHVFGIDVLDATIPGTMYNVDTHNNHLQIFYVDASISSIVTTSFDAMCNVFSDIGFNTLLQRWCNDASRDCYVAVVDGTVWDAYVGGTIFPLSVSGASPPYPESGISHSRVLIKRRILNVPLSTVSSVVNSTDTRSFLHSGTTYFFDASLDPTTAATLTSGIGVSLERSSVIGFSSATYTITYFDSVELTTPLYNPGWSLACPTIMAFWIVNVFFETGNYVLNPPTSVNDASLVAEITSALLPLRITPGSTSSGLIDKQIRLGYTGDATNPFAFNFASSSCSLMLGFDSHAKNSVHERRAVPFGDGPPLYMSLPAPSGNFTIIPPGIVNLLGVRYVILRCPEIEEHLNSTETYGKQATGVGVFKLSSSAELFNLRFDFVSLIRKPFHPIGRMHRLTLRFERENGELYDFKGINNTLLLTIKYYNPTQQLRFTGSILNPDYDPDFMTYMSRIKRDDAMNRDFAIDDETDDHVTTTTSSTTDGVETRARRVKNDVVRRILSEENAQLSRMHDRK